MIHYEPGRVKEGATRRAAAVRGGTPEAYFPHGQAPARALSYIVRTAGDPTLLLNSIRGAVRELDPCVAASFGPALRAARMDPLGALRQE